ncbi:hypothetical protein WICMUC_005037 [Wickerhamomyces mucosus]|uniref:Uncharacterized protein n=1 Tax=Wickerhamomyces mucosus TaxID=1378264 RepID=A0A9P8T7H8_9ASCO|nr:hypothetical protein WICMUC_005037 [Wickerhamomyces mucosus]
MSRSRTSTDISDTQKLYDSSDNGLTIQDDATLLNHRPSVHYRAVKYLSKFKVFHVPILNWTVITFFFYSIYELIKRYESMYASNILFTTITANILLYGLSDSLAQSLSCFIGTVSINSDNDRSISITMSDLYSQENLFTDYGDVSPLSDPQNLLSQNPQYQMLSNQTDVDVFNFQRFIGFMFWGFSMAFIQVVWYWILNHFYTKDPTIVSAIARVLTDQLLFSPISLFSFFSYSNYFLESGDKFTLHQKIRKIYLSTLAANYMVWPLVQFLNFLFMPKRFQVPFSSSSKLSFSICILEIQTN